VKADPFAQLRLLDLQELDTTLTRLAHRRGHLPELTEIERLDKLVDGTRDEVVRLETEASDLARTTKKFEDEITQVRTRKQRNDERLASGSITQAKQLEDLQHENVSLARRQADLEDQEIEVMEQAEQVQSALDALVAERDGRLVEREAAVVARDDAWVEVDAEIERTKAERATVAAELPADLVALYDKIRAAEGGIGAGAIGQGRCSACRLDLMQNEKADARAAAPDEVLRHEECRRILVRTAESGL
jgi:predicted  nucleic acid-binding Zn-ribbon protein